MEVISLEIGFKVFCFFKSKWIRTCSVLGLKNLPVLEEVSLVSGRINQISNITKTNWEIGFVTLLILFKETFIGLNVTKILNYLIGSLSILYTGLCPRVWVEFGSCHSFGVAVVYAPACGRQGYGMCQMRGQFGGESS